MKKWYRLFGIVLMFSLMACSDDTKEPEGKDNDVEQIENENPDEKNEDQKKDQEQQDEVEETLPEDKQEADQAAVLLEEVEMYDEIVNGELLDLYMEAQSSYRGSNEDNLKSNLELIILPNIYDVIMGLDNLQSEITSSELLGLHAKFRDNMNTLYEGLYDIYNSILNDDTELKAAGEQKMNEAIQGIATFDNSFKVLKNQALIAMHKESPNYNEVKTELTRYVEIMYGELGDQNLEVFLKYKENQGAYYPGDAEFAQLMTTELLPKSEAVYNELVNLSSTLVTEEISELHNIVVMAVTLRNDGYKKMLDGANQGSEAMKKDAAFTLGESDEQMALFKEEIEELMIAYEVITEEDLKFVY